MEANPRDAPSSPGASSARNQRMERAMEAETRVQSKGRARARPSKFIILVSSSELAKKRKAHSEFQMMEHVSKEECYRPPPESMDVG